MAQIPGLRFDITGASGSQGLLTPKSGWRAYVFPRGGYAAQDSAGTKITFDSSAIVGRFAVGNWIQVGEAATIRQVAAVGGNSLTVSGAAVTVTTGNRIFIIGNTEPTVSGGSVTYSTPATTIRQRDDDASDLYTNSMVTTNANGLVQFFSTPGIYDILVQDGNRAIQGSLIDVPVGLAEGVSTSQASTFGASVTISGTVLINAVVGITGNLIVFGNIVTGGSQGNISALGSMSTNVNMTVGGLLDQQGLAQFGVTATFNANVGTTGNVLVGRSLTVNSNAGITGTLIVGQTATFSANAVTTDLYVRRIVANRGTTVTGAHWSISGWGSGSTISIGAGSNDTQGSATITSGTSASVNPTADFTFADGAYAFAPWFVSIRSFVVAATDDQPNTPINGNPLSTTQARVCFVGATPSNSSNYFFRWLTIGDKA